MVQSPRPADRRIAVPSVSAALELWRRRINTANHFMPIYKFYQDVLCTSWERRHFTVTAQNQEEADMIAAQCKDTPLCFDPDAEPGETVYCVFEDETLLETVEPLPITDNHGKPTIEVYRSNDDLFIADNYKNREL